MFTHLTGQARRVLQLAHQEAASRSHDYLGTEHLLLALLREGGRASRILETCSVPVHMLRDQLDAELEPGHRALDIEKLPLTLSVQRVLQFAGEEARDRHLDEVGQDHLLLGLLREEESEAAQLLEVHGMTLNRCRAEIQRHAQEENRDRLVLTTLPTIPGATRDPSSEELEERLSAQVLPREWHPQMHSGSVGTVAALEMQLRGTQLVLAGVLGGFILVELYGWRGLLSGVFIGVLLGSFQSSLLSSMAGALGGFFIGFQYINLGAWIVIITTLVGFFLGSWVGNVWRPQQPKPRETQDNAFDSPYHD